MRSSSGACASEPAVSDVTFSMVGSRRGAARWSSKSRAGAADRSGRLQHRGGQQARTPGAIQPRRDRFLRRVRRADHHGPRAPTPADPGAADTACSSIAPWSTRCSAAPIRSAAASATSAAAAKRRERDVGLDRWYEIVGVVPDFPGQRGARRRARQPRLSRRHVRRCLSGGARGARARLEPG